MSVAQQQQQQQQQPPAASWSTVPSHRPGHVPREHQQCASGSFDVGDEDGDDDGDDGPMMVMV